MTCAVAKKRLNTLMIDASDSLSCLEPIQFQRCCMQKVHGACMELHGACMSLHGTCKGCMANAWSCMSHAWSCMALVKVAG